MAGYGHGSATGIDERTLGRIDTLLFDADYRDADAGVEDAWRVAVFAAEPRLRDAHERARATAVHAANVLRDPGAAPVRHASAVHRVSLVIALLLAALAAALILTGPSRTASLQIVLLPAGAAAAIAVCALWWLEPRRADGSLWGSRIPALLYLVCASLWLFAGGFAFLARWGEIDAHRSLAATTGLALLIAAAASAVLLWHRARRSDRSGRQSGLARLTGGLVDPSDSAQVFFALDAWWSEAGPLAMARNAAHIRRVRIEVLARLRQATVITRLDEQFAVDDPVPARWRERRR